MILLHQDFETSRHLQALRVSLFVESAMGARLASAATSWQPDTLSGRWKTVSGAARA